MPPVIDGPKSPLFTPISFEGNINYSNLPEMGVSKEMAQAVEYAPSESCVCAGIPFEVKKPIFVNNYKPVYLPE